MNEYVGCEQFGASEAYIYFFDPDENPTFWLGWSAQRVLAILGCVLALWGDLPATHGDGVQRSVTRVK